jgi:hypothetical protein
MECLVTFRPRQAAATAQSTGTGLGDVGGMSLAGMEVCCCHCHGHCRRRRSSRRGHCRRVRAAFSSCPRATAGRVRFLRFSHNGAVQYVLPVVDIAQGRLRCDISTSKRQCALTHEEKARSISLHLLHVCVHAVTAQAAVHTVMPMPGSSEHLLVGTRSTTAYLITQQGAVIKR